MKFFTLAALAGVATAWTHNNSKDFAHCWTCKCGDEVCQHKESDCIFDRLTDGTDELTFH